MALTEFGPFAIAFDRGELKVPGYLELLGLNDNDSQVVIDRIERASATGDPRPWVDALLNDANWRPHLVAAIAFLLDDRDTLDRHLLWKAIDSGSWVTPQLVVTAAPRAKLWALVFVDRAPIAR
jgi:hypothetical protein